MLIKLWALFVLFCLAPILSSQNEISVSYDEFSTMYSLEVSPIDTQDAKDVISYTVGIRMDYDCDNGFDPSVMVWGGVAYQGRLRVYKRIEFVDFSDAPFFSTTADWDISANYHIEMWRSRVSVAWLKNGQDSRFRVSARTLSPSFHGVVSQAMKQELLDSMAELEPTDCPE